MIFIWNARKAIDNVRKHGVSFEEAITAFFDQDQLTALDEAHSIDEDRWITIGASVRSRVLVVITTEIDEETIRVISARKATRREVKSYEEARKRASRGQ